METKEESKDVTVSEASQILHISARTIYNYIKEKRLKSKKVGNKTVINFEDLQEIVKQGVKFKPSSQIDTKTEIVVDREKWEGMTYKLGLLEERCRIYEIQLLEARRLVEYKPIKRAWWKRLFNRG